MYCPKCGNEDTKVLESRVNVEGRSVRRRRSCMSCEYRFTTYEKEEDFVFQVQKRDGRVEPYQREKAIRSLQIACQKRPISLEDLEALLSRIEKNIQDDGSRVVPSLKLGELLLAQLHELDKVAYVRFASVYKDFKDPEEFLKELRTL